MRSSSIQYNALMEPSVTMAPRVARALGRLEADLKTIFGARLVSLVLYGRHVPATSATAASLDGATPVNTLALVNGLSYADLAACAAKADGWAGAGLAMPLLLSPTEFASSLDAFPLEYGAIIDRHLAIAGDDPFKGISVKADDRRRACEVQAKSHLIHLREGFLQAEGRGTAVARLIHQSLESFGSLLGHLAELDRRADDSPAAIARYAASRIGLSESLVMRLLSLADQKPLSGDEAAQLYPPYLDASERVARFVDGWKETAHA
jgi:hypothetical protein